MVPAAVMTEQVKYDPIALERPRVRPDTKVNLRNDNGSAEAR